MRGFSSIVLTSNKQNLEQFPWVPIYSKLDMKYYFAYRVMRKIGIIPYPPIFDEAIKKHHPLILHSHFADKGWFDLPIAKKHGLNHVVSFYGYDVNMLPQKQIWKNRYKELFDKANLFLCEGPHMAKCIQKLGCPKEKLIVQKLGVDLGKIKYVPRRIEKDGFFKILIAGRFCEKKGIPYALEAIGILKNKYPNIRVTIIGDASEEMLDQQEKEKILSVVKRYDLDPIIRMLGYQPFSVLLEEAYKHHLFISTSITASNGDTEGGAPVSILEMSASGMPVIGTYHADIPKVVINGKTGLLFNEKEIALLSKGIERFMSGKENIKNMGKHGRIFIRSKFNVINTTISLGKVYKKLLNN